MSFLQRLADRMILVPSTHEIDAQGKRQLLVDVDHAQIEIWSDNIGVDTNQPSSQFLAIKFPGAAGRAERSTIHPFGFWSSANVEVWTVNHRGYGSSTPPASTTNFVETIDAVWRKSQEIWPDRPVIVCGNSLGSISALNMAARYPVAGVFLRNPVPLQQMIATRPRYAWPSLGLSRLIAEKVPVELDAVINAENTECPLLFVRSEKDRVIPHQYQQMIWDGFAGPKQEFIIRGADHHHRIGEDQESEYLNSLEWLLSQIS